MITESGTWIEHGGCQGTENLAQAAKAHLFVDDSVMTEILYIVQKC